MYCKHRIRFATRYHYRIPLAPLIAFNILVTHPPPQWIVCGLICQIAVQPFQNPSYRKWVQTRAPRGKRYNYGEFCGAADSVAVAKVLASRGLTIH